MSIDKLYKMNAWYTDTFIICLYYTQVFHFQRHRPTRKIMVNSFLIHNNLQCFVIQTGHNMRWKLYQRSAFSASFFCELCWKSDFHSVCTFCESESHSHKRTSNFIRTDIFAHSRCRKFFGYQNKTAKRPQKQSQLIVCCSKASPRIDRLHNYIPSFLSVNWKFSKPLILKLRNYSCPCVWHLQGRNHGWKVERNQGWARTAKGVGCGRGSPLPLWGSGGIISPPENLWKLRC